LAIIPLITGARKELSGIIFSTIPQIREKPFSGRKESAVKGKKPGIANQAYIQGRRGK